MFIAEYIWIDNNKLLRSKSRNLSNYDINCNDIESIPKWNFDGSSTNDARGNDSEVILYPRKIFIDPFMLGTKNHIFGNNNRNYILVLCDCYNKNRIPIASNTRYIAKTIFDKVINEIPWFGFEQEFVLYDNITNRPLGWPIYTDPEKQGKYYCGVGADRVFGRNIIIEHYNHCLNMNLDISGINAEVMPGQWEYQIGPCTGIDAGDQLWISRYILLRVCEKHNVSVNFNPKPQKGDWNGSGLHTNFSSCQMRKENGIKYIYCAIDKLSKKHKEHLLVYGDNSERLTGNHETSSPCEFTYGIADRTASIRIPLFVEENKCGYFEDRRPASDADPYLVSSKLVETIFL